jgi:hypothetical protein
LFARLHSFKIISEAAVDWNLPASSPSVIFQIAAALHRLAVLLTCFSAFRSPPSGVFMLGGSRFADCFPDSLHRRGGHGRY